MTQTTEHTTVKLRNGAEEFKPLVAVTMMSLKSVMESNPIAFYELACLARDRDHKLFGNTGEVLQARALVSAEGTMHDSIRNIVLSAVEGDMLEMTLRSPIEDGS